MFKKKISLQKSFTLKISHWKKTHQKHTRKYFIAAVMHPKKFQTPIGIKEITSQNCEMLWTNLTPKNKEILDGIIKNGIPTKESFTNGFPVPKPISVRYFLFEIFLNFFSHSKEGHKIYEKAVSSWKAQKKNGKKKEPVNIITSNGSCNFTKFTHNISKLYKKMHTRSPSSFQHLVHL